jgi:uncharacterized RDD family membrane protein YckC/ribosomal protein L40E
MHCRNCGKEIADEAAVCVQCGSKPLAGDKYCPTCGAPTGPQAEYCIKCGTNLAEASAAVIKTTEYAGFWRRFVALIIDGLLLGIVGRLVFGRFAVPFLLFPKIKSLMAPNFFFSYFTLGWVYYSLMESSYRQATLGKMAIGIMVTDLEGKRISFARATGRHFAKIISLLILYIGFIMAGFTHKKQALHDLIADCLVVKKPKNNS